jgi:hypothetical protein
MFTFVGLAVVMFGCILLTWFHEISSNYSAKICTHDFPDGFTELLSNLVEATKKFAIKYNS